MQATEKTWSLKERTKNAIVYSGWRKGYYTHIEMTKYNHPACTTTIDGVSAFYPAKQDNHITVERCVYDDQEPRIFNFKVSFLTFEDAEIASRAWMERNGGIA